MVMSIADICMRKAWGTVTIWGNNRKGRAWLYGNFGDIAGTYTINSDYHDDFKETVEKAGLIVDVL